MNRSFPSIGKTLKLSQLGPERKPEPSILENEMNYQSSGLMDHFCEENELGNKGYNIVSDTL